VVPWNAAVVVAAAAAAVLDKATRSALSRLNRFDDFFSGLLCVAVDVARLVASLTVAVSQARCSVCMYVSFA